MNDRCCLSCVYYRGFWCSKNALTVRPHHRCSGWCGDAAEAQAITIPKPEHPQACSYCYKGKPHLDPTSKTGWWCMDMGMAVEEPVYSCSRIRPNHVAEREAYKKLEKEQEFKACCGKCRNLKFYFEATNEFACSKRAGKWQTSNIDAKWDCSNFEPGEPMAKSKQRTVVRLSCVHGGV